MKRRGAQPQVAPRFISAPSSRGWSLIELIVVLMVAGVLAFFAVRAFQPKEALALEQAERLRNDLRRVQMLAMSWNEALRITVVPIAGPVPARYEVSCVSGSATPPCNGAAPVIDPATGTAFSINFESGLDLSGPGFALDFDALGRPRNGAALITGNATFTVSGAGVSRTVTVTPVTGFAAAQ